MLIEVLYMVELQVNSLMGIHVHVCVITHCVSHNSHPRRKASNRILHTCVFGNRNFLLQCLVPNSPSYNNDTCAKTAHA